MNENNDYILKRLDEIEEYLKSFQENSANTTHQTPEIEILKSSELAKVFRMNPNDVASLFNDETFPRNFRLWR